MLRPVFDQNRRLWLFRPRPVKSTKWAHLDRPDFNIVNDLSSYICNAERAAKIDFPDLRRVNRLIVTSDYRTPDDRCDFHVITYLIMGADSITTWELQRGRWRQQYLPDGRRLGFKNLGKDDLQRRAVEPFLAIANGIDGLIVSVAFHKDITSIFSDNGRVRMDEPDLTAWSHWKSTPFENALRVLHFASFFLAGLTRDNQEIVWISDRDQIISGDGQIAGDSERLQDFCDISNQIMPHYVRHRLRLKTATTKQDDGTLFAEDLAAIPDLVAGTLGEVLTTQSRHGVLPNTPLTTFLPPSIQGKTQAILSWYLDRGQPLRRLLLRFTRGSNPGSIVSGIEQYEDGINALDV